MNSSPRRIRLGITTGDPAGIGPEIIAKALASPELPPEIECRVIGDPDAPGIQPGRPDTRSARAALDALEESVRLARRREIDGIVTGPISKANLHGIGFPFPGHTEFYAHRLDALNSAMILTSPDLTVALVTVHVPLAAAIGALSVGEIVRVGTLLAGFLSARLGRSPRVAVAGLNPHAGESGMLGIEDRDIVAPAVEILSSRAPGRATFQGPLPPDTLFHRIVRDRTHDAALCMYHDQALIPFKLLAFDSGVNVTVGLPLARTSPDHGTAFDIAGRGIARPHSMLAAIRLAAELVSGARAR